MKRIRLRAANSFLIMIVALLVAVLFPGQASADSSPDWSPMTSGTTHSLHAVWGSSSSDVFAVGGGGIILHHSAAAQAELANVQSAVVAMMVANGLSALPNPVTVATNDMTAFPDPDYSLYPDYLLESTTIGTYTCDADGTVTQVTAGDEWSSMTSGTTSHLRGVWGSSSSDVFAVGGGGIILHYSAAAAQAELANVQTAVVALMADVGLGTLPNPVTAATNDMTAFPDPDYSLYPDYLLESTTMGTYTCDADGTVTQVTAGDDWNSMTSGATHPLYAVWGSSSSDVFAVGDYGTILHYDGSSWSPMTSGTTSHLRGVWGSSSSDVFFVGGGGIILHYSAAAAQAELANVQSAVVALMADVGLGTLPNPVTAATNDMTAFPDPDYSLYPDYLLESTTIGTYTCDADGTVTQVTAGDEWSSMTSGTTHPLYAVWGSSPSDVFAVGGGGTILHYSGAAQTELANVQTAVMALMADVGLGTIPNPVTTATNDMTAFPDPDYPLYPDYLLESTTIGTYTCDADGTVTQVTAGDDWSPMTSGTTHSLHAVWGSSSSDVFAAGSGGTILHYSGAAPDELANVQTAVVAMMVANGLSALPNPVTVATNDMSAFPDATSACGIDKVNDLDGNAYQAGLDKDGFLLYGHDITADGAQTGLINYMAVQATMGTYTVDASGTVTQVTTGDHWSAMSSGTTSDLYAVWGSSSSDVFAVGDYGTIPHYGPPAQAPPTADAGGPYTVDEGGSVTLDGSGSFAPDGYIVLYEWDLDNDGQYDDATGVTTDAVLDDNGSFIVGLRVTDEFGASDTDVAEATVNNVAPTVGPISAPIDPVAVGTSVTASADFTDAGVLDTHTALWDWGDGTTSEGTVGETNGSGSVTGSHAYTATGVYAVTLMVTDDDGGSGQSGFTYVVVYDPSAGFVTGGGWIDSPEGAYTSDPSLTGKANFGFVCKYQKGADIPSGETQFQFKVADLNLHSTSYQWLVIAGAKAQFKGSGTINGSGDYGFMLTATDGEIDGGGGVDKFRIKIWDTQTGEVIYDNGIGDATQAIGGGSIVIHSK
jgi:hypothetical protein